MITDRGFDPERRRFLGTAAATAAAAAALAGCKSRGAGSASSASSSSPPPSPVAKHLTAAIHERYKAAISTARLPEIEEGIGGAVGYADALAKIPVANGEEPAFVFIALKP